MLYKYEEDYVEKENKYSVELLKQLAAIPAPSYHEEKRARFCKQWFEERGIEQKLILLMKTILHHFILQLNGVIQMLLNCLLISIMQVLII